MISYPLRSISFIVFILYLANYSIFADEIYLSNGQNANTTILDTIGCYIKINRNGKEVKINKESISKIIIMSDTINYSGYKCQDVIKTNIIRYQDTPEYKLLAFIENCDEIEQVFEEGSDIIFIITPLQGHYNVDEFIGIQKPLIDLFGKKATLINVSPDDVLNELNNTKSKYKYAFIPRKYHVETYATPSSGFKKAMSFGKQSSREKKKVLITSAEYVLLNLDRKEIVYHPKEFKKRSVYGENEYSWSSIFTPDEWEEKWEKHWTERKMDKNAQTVRKKLINNLKTYLKIEE